MVNEDGSGHHMDAVLDIATAVEELHRLSAQEMKKCIQESQILTLSLPLPKGNSINIDVEKLAATLPVHLLACAASSISQPRFSYLLRGIRLLHSLGNLASRYPKLEQMLLQEVTRREQIIDLVIFMLIVLSDVEPDGRWGTFLAVLHSALVVCCLYLLKVFITSDWREVAPVLLAHPKVDIFMDVAFDAVRRDIGLLQGRFKALVKYAKEKTPTPGDVDQLSSTTLQQCEASLQILQALSESQSFRDRLLNNKELCKNGGILLLVLAVLQLQLPSHLQDSQLFVTSISRLKSKVLAMLLKFCETESVSFLDEVAVDPRSLHVAKLVAGEIVLLVKTAFFEPFSPDSGAMGLVYLNSMRLADVLSDDSNFRNLFMDNIAPDLATILAMGPSEFRSKWCGGRAAHDMAYYETDAVLSYDPFHGSGAAMTFKTTASSSAEQAKPGFVILSDVRPEPAFYVQELSALLVKLFANLHCFNPDVCPADEKDRFLCLFMQCLTEGPFCPTNNSYYINSDQTAVRVCENLHILVDHVASLSPDLANDEDVQLASVFAAELHEAFCLSPDSSLEAIADLRESHEKRLKGIVSLREQSERWRRLQRASEPEPEPVPAPTDGEEQTPNPTQQQTSVPPVPHAPPVPEEGSSDADNMAGIPEQDLNASQPNVEAVVPDVDGVKENGMKEPEETPVKDLNETPMKEETPAQEPRSSILHSAGPSLELKTPSCEPSSRLAYEQTSSGGPWSGSGSEKRSRIDTSDKNEPKKRQRRIMTEPQILLIEDVLRNEPEMQRYPELVQKWTNELNRIGPEISCNQLKNWINNRKAKMAKLAKEGRIDSGEKMPPNAENYKEATGNTGRYFAYQRQPGATPKPVETKANDSSSKIHQTVILRDETGRDVAVGTIQAITPGERGTGDVCLVKVSELRVERTTRIPIGSDSLGTTFDEAERKLGSMIVAWRFNNLLVTH